jgi:hypothetical protein
VRDVSNNTYHDRWPLHGLHARQIWILWILTCGDTYKPIDNEEALHPGTVDACQTVRNQPGIFGRMRWSMMRRVEARIEISLKTFWALIINVLFQL